MKQLLRTLIRIGALLAVFAVVFALLLLCALTLVAAAVQTIGEVIAVSLRYLMERDFWLASAEKLGAIIRSGQVRP